MKIKRLLATAFIAISLVSTFAMSASAYNDSYDGNYQNRYIEIEYYSNSGGTPYVSPTVEEKLNTTPIYVYNYSSSGGTIDAWVNRTNSNNSSSVTVDRYYGGYSYMPYNGPDNMKRVSLGTYKYLTSWVYEDGYKYAGLGYIMNTEWEYYKLAWSPDSLYA